MVHDAIWDRVRGGLGMLCIGCLETRLGRKLNSLDFNSAPLNEMGHWQSERLQSRIQEYPMKPTEEELKSRFMPRASEWDYPDGERLTRRLYLDTAISLVVMAKGSSRTLSIALTELEGAMLWAIHAIQE